MAKRKPISKKVRFEVFKRDSFKCQYCGLSAPDVVLHVDHIKPVSKGGDNDLYNLVTSCAGCNGGKGATELDDDSVLQKQRAQLEELNERREQLEMMLQWREGLKSVSDMGIDAVASAWAEAVDPYHLNDSGRQSARKLVRQYGLNLVLDAIEVAADAYLKHDEEGVVTGESVELAWNKVGGICRLKTQPDYMKDLYYIRGILRNRLHYLNEGVCLNLLKQAYDCGCEIEWLSDLSKEVRNWTEWQREMYEMISNNDGSKCGS